MPTTCMDFLAYTQLQQHKVNNFQDRCWFLFQHCGPESLHLLTGYREYNRRSNVVNRGYPVIQSPTSVDLTSTALRTGVVSFIVIRSGFCSLALALHPTAWIQERTQSMECL